MIPPICAVCGKDFRDSINEGGSVSFKLSKLDIEFNKTFEEKGSTGHKAGLEWFCKDHYKLAKKCSDLTLYEAISKIKKRKY